MEESNNKDFLPINHRTDRDIVQSYIFTFSRYGELTICEKRILYNMIYDRQIQDYVRENIESHSKGADKPLFPSLIGFKIPLNKITQNKGTYEDVKKAFISLAKKGFEYEDNSIWKFLNFIILPRIKKGEGVAYFQVPLEVYNVITEISKGYRQFNFDIALSLKSIYAMRFYEMFSRQNDASIQPQKMKIETLKRLFKLEDKYTINAMFIKRVIEPAKKELDKKANFSFDYELQKSLGSRKYDIIVFNIYHIPENEKNNTELLENRTKAIISQAMPIPTELYEKLLEMGFNKDEILKNRYTLIVMYDKYKKEHGINKAVIALLSKIDELKQKGLIKDRDNWKPYIMGTLKKMTGIKEEGKRKEIAQEIIERETNQTEIY